MGLHCWLVSSALRPSAKIINEFIQPIRRFGYLNFAHPEQIVTGSVSPRARGLRQGRRGRRLNQTQYRKWFHPKEATVSISGRNSIHICRASNSPSRIREEKPGKEPPMRLPKLRLISGIASSVCAMKAVDKRRTANGFIGEGCESFPSLSSIGFCNQATFSGGRLWWRHQFRYHRDSKSSKASNPGARKLQVKPRDARLQGSL